jgi:hypothetical protein
MTDEATTGKRLLAPSDYLDKPATPLHDRFGVWIKEEVGYNPSTAKTKEEAFQAGVRLATATRMVFQASDFNRSETAKLRAARESEVAAAASAPKAAPAPKATAPAKAAKPAKKAAAAVPAPTPAGEPKPVRRPARRAAATVTKEEAPF